ncbi:hypothetical protein ACLESO_45510, partial [Pyxidicoccus sp. 3LG]
RERRALRAAIAADPTLPEDPDFVRRYQQLQEQEATKARDETQRAEALQQFQDNPRLGRDWGLGLDFFSSRGVLVINAILVARKDLYPYLAFDIGFGGIDAGVRWTFVSSRFSPFIGSGVHVGIPGFSSTPTRVGIGDEDITNRPDDPDDINSEDVFKLNIHLDGGIQWISEGGFFLDGGVGLIIYPKDGSPRTQVMPIIGLGWLF